MAEHVANIFKQAVGVWSWRRRNIEGVYMGGEDVWICKTIMCPTMVLSVAIGIV